MPHSDWGPTATLWPGQGTARAVLRAIRSTAGCRLPACRARLLALGATLLTAVVVPVVWWGYSRAVIGHQADGSAGAEPSPTIGDRVPTASRGGLVAGLAAPLVPIVPLHASINPAHWFTHILNATAGALTTFIGSLFTDVIISFLMLKIPPSPGTAPNSSMNAAYSQNLQYTLMLLPLVVLLGLAITPVSRRDRASLRRQLWRLILVFIALGAGQPFLRLAGQTVNVTTQLVAPQQYVFGFGGQLMSNGLESLLGSGLVVALGLILIDLGIIVLGALVLGFLYLRQFLFQMVYIGFPLLVLAWYLDWGPLRYSKQVANLVFSITGLLAVLGPVIALGLQTGCVVAGAQSASGCFTGSATVSQSASAPDLWRRFLGWATGLALAMILPMRIGRMVGMPMAMGGSGSGSGAGAEGGGGGGDGGTGGGVPAAATEGGDAAAAAAEGPEARPPQAADEAMGGARQRAANLGGDISSVSDITRDSLGSAARWSGADGVTDRVGEMAETATEGMKNASGKAGAAAGTVAEQTPETWKTAGKTGLGAAYVAGREAVAAGKFIHNNPRAGIKTMSKHAIGRVRSQQWSQPADEGITPSGTAGDPAQAELTDTPGVDEDMFDDPDADAGTGAGAQDEGFSPGPDTDQYEKPPERQLQLDDEYFDRSIQSTFDYDFAGGGGGQDGGSDGGGGAIGERTPGDATTRSGPDYTEDTVDTATGDPSEFWDEDF